MLLTSTCNHCKKGYVGLVWDEFKCLNCSREPALRLGEKARMAGAIVSVINLYQGNKIRHLNAENPRERQELERLLYECSGTSKKSKDRHLARNKKDKSVNAYEECPFCSGLFPVATDGTLMKHKPNAPLASRIIKALRLVDSQRLLA